MKNLITQTELNGETLLNYFFGVRIIDTTTGRDVPIQEFGYLGNLNPGRHDIVFYAHKHAITSHSVFAYSMHKQTNQKVWQINKVDQIETNPASNNIDANRAFVYEDAFATTVEVFKAKDNRTENWVAYPANGFRIVVVQPDGTGAIYDVSIFAQNGKFWLSTGKKYSFCISNDGNKSYLTHESLNNEPQWEQLRKFIIENAKIKPEKITLNLPIVGTKIPPLNNKEVYVKFFNPTYGKGAGVINDGGTLRECSIHYTRIPKNQNPKQPRIVEDGKIYTTTGGVKIPDSPNSTFTWEITSMIYPIDKAVTA